jgi:hypothetical protein
MATRDDHRARCCRMTMGGAPRLAWRYRACGLHGAVGERSLPRRIFRRGGDAHDATDYGAVGPYMSDLCAFECAA